MPPAPCTIGSKINAAIRWESFSRVCLSSATSAEAHDSPNRHFGCSIKNCLGSRGGHHSGAPRRRQEVRGSKYASSWPQEESGSEHPSPRCSSLSNT